MPPPDVAWGIRCRALGFPTAILVALVCCVSAASAEPYLSGYVGAAFTDRTDLNTDLQINGTPFVNGRLHDVGFENGLLYGGKVGYYFEAPVLRGNLGVEAEAFHFRNAVRPQNVRFVGTLGGAPADITTRIQRADIDVTATALNLLYRLPLWTDANFPRGRFQPYAGVGLAVLMSELSTQTTPLDVNEDISDRDVQPAVQVLAGVRQFITPHLAVFFEYRFLHSAPFDFTFRVPGTIGGAPVTETARDRAGLTTHQLTGGIGFHW